LLRCRFISGRGYACSTSHRRQENWFNMNPTVAIVGRPNVGKSALFNRLARRQVSLVFDRPGTTRDRVVANCKWHRHEFTLIDTGGIGLEDKEGFSDAIEEEVELALSAATDIMMVVDARAGLAPLDREVAKRLRQSKARVLVVANKVDDLNKQAFLENEFAALGFGIPHAVSAAHGTGIEGLLTELASGWPEPAEEPEELAVRAARPVRIAIVGRPNVGKSSLVNALLEKSRTIVSSIPGTTRDAVDVPYTWNGQQFTIIDTAGMRQQRRVDDQLEADMSGRSVHTINRADLCVLVIDAESGVTMQDKKIAGLIQEACCPCLVVINKWDLARDKGDGGKAREREYYNDVQRDLFFLPYAPVLFLSAKTRERVDGLMKMTQTIAKNRHFRFQTGPLNRVLAKAMERQGPPQMRGRRFKILYAAQQVDNKPGAREIPTLILFVNQPGLMTAPYERYLELQLRESFDLVGCPIKFILKGREQRSKSKTTAGKRQRS
jgi:GTP-binding protein